MFFKSQISSTLLLEGVHFFLKSQTSRTSLLEGDHLIIKSFLQPMAYLFVHLYVPNGIPMAANGTPLRL